MERKNLVASLYLKNGEAVLRSNTEESAGEIHQLAKTYNDSGIDKLLIFDLSASDEEHDTNLQVIKEINRMIEIPVCVAGNINGMEDIKKVLYSGCKQVILNSAKSNTVLLAEEGYKRFGKEKLALSISNVDLLFKHQGSIEQNITEIYVINEELTDTIENVTDLPCTVVLNTYNLERILDLLSRDQVHGISGEYFERPETTIMELKLRLAENGISIRQLESSLDFSAFKTTETGLIPVVVQDYQSLEVLMLAYMNLEAYEKTITSGRMTYFSRSRNELWVKGETSGHYQYVKSIFLDCDNDTILAKVSQVGAACHTGAYSCFFKELVKREYAEKNPFKVFESVFSVIEDRKENPREGSYTNYLFDKGIDKILKKVGEEAAEIIIAAKNPNPEEVKYEISDFLYHIMVLMAEKGITWDEIARDLADR
jgi:phosphoribosyl-ATP pyrophosphohydrolase/phosphoribosyl-AMP cyclohydrolase